MKMTDFIGIVFTAIATGMGVAIGMPIGEWIRAKIKQHYNNNKKIFIKRFRFGDNKNE